MGESAQVISLGGRLKQRREELGLSQAQAARELDVARTAYRLWEMEAAKPAPDRWRLISRWLGVSVVTLLLAEELIDEQEADGATTVTADFGPSGTWDASGASSEGDFFAQERATIQTALHGGTIDASAATALMQLLTRVEESAPAGTTFRTRRGEFDKVLPIDPSLPSLGRAAFLVLAAGIPDDQLRDGELLTSELITGALRGEPGTDGVIRLHMTLNPAATRVEVQTKGSKQSRRLHEAERWGMTLISELASRWGTGHEEDMRISWFEIDLPEPGSKPFATA